MGGVKTYPAGCWSASTAPTVELRDEAERLSSRAPPSGVPSRVADDLMIVEMIVELMRFAKLAEAEYQDDEDRTATSANSIVPSPALVLSNRRTAAGNRNQGAVRCRDPHQLVPAVRGVTLDKRVDPGHSWECALRI